MNVNIDIELDEVSMEEAKEIRDKIASLLRTRFVYWNIQLYEVWEMSDLDNKSRITITLDPDILENIDSRVPGRKRSKYINKVLRTWFEVVDNEWC